MDYLIILHNLPAPRQGPGTMMYANGDIFEGMWAGDKKHGSGTHFYISKVRALCWG